MERLHEIHQRIGEIEGGSMQEEFPEQLCTVSVLDEDDRVLEIGCNIGRNSLVIASLVKPGHLVAIDACPEYTVTCARNRARAGLNFLILPIAISKVPLMRHKWNTFPLVTPLPLDHFPVNSLRWSQFNSLYGPFTCCIVDSEGSLFDTLREEDTFLQDFNKIVIENDFDTEYKKNFVHREFVRAGFHCVTSFTPWAEGPPDVFEVWKKPA